MRHFEDDVFGSRRLRWNWPTAGLATVPRPDEQHVGTWGVGKD